MTWGRGPVHPLALLLVAAAALVAALASTSASGGHAWLQIRQRRASEVMAKGIAVIRAERAARGAWDLTADPNRTGLIGPRSTPITTSVGVLTAKRTATNPNMAAVIVRMLWEAGVRPGSVVAMGFSGSFPSLNLAGLAAAGALEVRPLVITALGASNWGATDPTFTWLDLEAVLVRNGIGARSIAASIGGERDRGLDLLPEGRRLLHDTIARHRVRSIDAPDLQTSSKIRMGMYVDGAAGRPIAAFVNIGGAQANLGACEALFLRAPGRVRTLPPCPADREGVAFQFFRRGIPVITLLNVRAIAIAQGLPIDPQPLPHPGRGGLYAADRTFMPSVALIAVIALAAGALRVRVSNSSI